MVSEMSSIFFRGGWLHIMAAIPENRLAPITTPKDIRNIYTMLLIIKHSPLTIFIITMKRTIYNITIMRIV
jgi:hypothetical protein